jgi:hypothetical protein
MEAGLSVVDARNRPTAYTCRDGSESQGVGRESLAIPEFFLVSAGMNPHSGMRTAPPGVSAVSRAPRSFQIRPRVNCSRSKSWRS